MAASSGCSFVAADAAIVEAFRRGDKSVVLIDSEHPECKIELLAAHAAVDKASGHGAAPLHAACYKGDDDCVQLLLAAHAAVDEADSYGYSPLFCACIEGHGGCARLLIAAHASID